MGEATVVSLFAGIGGFDIGFHRAGMQIALQCEQNKRCQSVLARHFPETPITDDVTSDETRNAIRRIRPDVICGGFPCQDVSMAGKRAGLAGKRSGLWFTFRDILAESRPRWVCIENVPGLLSSCDGRDMGTVLTGLGELGYWWAYRVFDSQWFGVAQRRKRVFIVGHLGDRARAAKVLFERTGLPWDSPPSREARPSVAATLTAGVAAGRGVNRPGRRREDDVNIVAATLNSGGNAGGFRTEPGEHLVPVYTLAIRGREEDSRLEYRSDGTANAVLTPTGGRSGIGVGAIAYRTSGNCGVMEQGDRTACLNTATDPNQQIILTPRMAVRRLTPRECERLQGFPDDWTRYAADGTELSDSARYQMLGNAVCGNVATDIARSIANAP